MTYRKQYTQFLLPPRSRGHPQKLTVPQPVKKFYGTRRFITAITSSHHLPLSWDRSIQSISPDPICWRTISIHLPSTPRFSKWTSSFSSPLQNPVCTSPGSPHEPHDHAQITLPNLISRLFRADTDISYTTNTGNRLNTRDMLQIQRNSAVSHKGPVSVNTVFDVVESS